MTEYERPVTKLTSFQSDTLIATDEFELKLYNLKAANVLPLHCLIVPNLTFTYCIYSI